MKKYIIIATGMMIISQNTHADSAENVKTALKEYTSAYKQDISDAGTGTQWVHAFDQARKFVEENNTNPVNAQLKSALADIMRFYDEIYRAISMINQGESINISSAQIINNIKATLEKVRFVEAEKNAKLILYIMGTTLQEIAQTVGSEMTKSKTASSISTSSVRQVSKDSAEQFFSSPNTKTELLKIVDAQGDLIKRLLTAIQGNPATDAFLAKRDPHAKANAQKQLQEEFERICTNFKNKFNLTQFRVSEVAQFLADSIREIVRFRFRVRETYNSDTISKLHDSLNAAINKVFSTR